VPLVRFHQPLRRRAGGGERVAHALGVLDGRAPVLLAVDEEDPCLLRGRSTERAGKDFARLTSMGEQSGGRTERLLSDRSLWPDLIQAAA